MELNFFIILYSAMFKTGGQNTDGRTSMLYSMDRSMMHQDTKEGMQHGVCRVN